MGTDCSCRCFHFGITRPGLAKEEVVRDTPREQIRLLSDEGDGATKVTVGDVSKIPPVEGDRAGGGILEAGNQFRHTRLPGPCRAEECDRFAASDNEVNRWQHLDLVGISETDPATNEVVERLGHSTDADIQKALKSAENAYRTFSKKTTVAERAKMMACVAELLNERVDELGRLGIEEFVNKKINVHGA